MNWRDEAACQGSDHRLFVGPENEPEVTKERREGLAKAVCAGCPVVRECLDHAIRTPERWGVYGGAGELERSYMRRSYLSWRRVAGAVGT